MLTHWGLDKLDISKNHLERRYFLKIPLFYSSVLWNHPLPFIIPE